MTVTFLRETLRWGISHHLSELSSAPSLYENYMLIQHRVKMSFNLFHYRIILKTIRQTKELTEEIERCYGTPVSTTLQGILWTKAHLWFACIYVSTQIVMFKVEFIPSDISV